MASVPTYEPEDAPQWVRDVVENLQREHDKRVEEYTKLEDALPRGRERDAILFAANTLRDTGHPLDANILELYMERLVKSDG
jgi:hypothetical protein